MATMKKAQAGKKVVKKPTYKNLRMGVAAASKTEGRDYTEKATKQDSINYVRGFNRGLRKDKETRNDLDEVEKMGRWEGLNTKKSGGPVKKAKSGGSFPDLNKDGKVTRADILKGRGVIAKKGATIKKAQMGGYVSNEFAAKSISKPKAKSRIVDSSIKTSKGKDIYAFQGKKGMLAKSGASMKNKGPKKAALGALLPLAMKAAPMVAGMLGGGGKGKSGGIGGMLGGLLGGKNGKNVNKAKSGGSMKKCKYGCK